MINKKYFAVITIMLMASSLAFSTPPDNCDFNEASSEFTAIAQEALIKDREMQEEFKARIEKIDGPSNRNGKALKDFSRITFTDPTAVSLQKERVHLGIAGLNEIIKPNAELSECDRARKLIEIGKRLNVVVESQWNVIDIQFSKIYKKQK
jgi:hypothetical protein